MMELTKVVRWRASRRQTSALAPATVLLLLTAVPTLAADWPQWRGPQGTGESEETGLISSWSTDGENLIWRSDFTGRSTAVVMGGRVFVTGRAGENETQREVVAAFDAENGKKLWEHHISTALTTVPFSRAGWAGPAGDEETGYIYVQGVAGPLICYDRDGNVVWQHSMYEEFGRYSGYGGRTHTPLVDEDRVIVSVINTSWGKMGPPRHRYFAFDKRTGEVLWVAAPGRQPGDLNTQGHGTIAVVDGQRLFISANADGHIYALKARTGEKVWEFHLSKGFVNATPVVVDGVVYVGHAEENVDVPDQGRTVAFSASGSGDITMTNELWRQQIGMGFPSPTVHGDVVYVMNNSANFYALDRKTGEVLWEHALGTVGKSAAVWADGKLYVTEVNGKFHILKPSREGVTVLDEEDIHMPSGRTAEIYASPAIAYGRIYFPTEEGLYCLGSKDRDFEVEASPLPSFAAEGHGSQQAAVLQVVPYDTTVRDSDTVAYEMRGYNELGQRVEVSPVQWSLDGIKGSFSGDGVLRFEGGTQVGEVVVKLGELEGRARVRAFAPLPYDDDFDDAGPRGRPWWIGAGRYAIVDGDGGKVLEKPLPPAGLQRSGLLVGPAFLRDYTVQADVHISQRGRRRGDVGLINSGYVFDARGVQQEIELRTWEAMKRISTTASYPVAVDTWYTMKLRVEPDEKGTLVLGKIWKRGEPEPAEWMLRVTDPVPSLNGAPGVIAYSPSPVLYDNLHVTVNP